MSNYSIKDLENLSGIKAHTLRIWEQRYNIVNPKRTETNIRYYDDTDLKLILNVSLLKDNGFKISTIAKMSELALKQEVINITQKSSRYSDQIQALTLAMIDLDENQFEKILSTSVLQLGFEKTMIHVIYPFLTRIGYLWLTNSINISQEHFISHLIRQKLIVAIDGQTSAQNTNTKKYLLFLPEGELHEIGLLFACYLIKAREQKTIYFGQSLPFKDLEEACKIHEPDYIITILTAVLVDEDAQTYINRLAGTFKNSTLLISGLQVVGQDLQAADNVVIFSKIYDLINFIEENKTN